MSHDAHQEFFDQLAAEWDLAYTATDLEFLDHLVGKLGTQEGWDVLDLGCGTGILFDMLRRRVGQDGTITGVDFSLSMAERALRNFPMANVNVIDADALALPFPDSLFDMAVAYAAFPHFSEKGKVIRELHRVLKNGATFHILHLSSSKEISQAHKDVGGIIAQDVIPDHDELHSLFDASRFDSVNITDQPGLYHAWAVNVK